MIGIPEKLYFKISEVCHLAEVKPHVLRYWESEFPIIRPQRASSKQRLYRRKDVENILRIRDLLYDEGFTIAGAKKALAAQRKGDDGEGNERTSTSSGAEKRFFKGIKEELQSLKKMLED